MSFQVGKTHGTITNEGNAIQTVKYTIVAELDAKMAAQKLARGE